MISLLGLDLFLIVKLPANGLETESTEWLCLCRFALSSVCKTGALAFVTVACPTLVGSLLLGETDPGEEIFVFFSVIGEPNDDDESPRFLPRLRSVWSSDIRWLCLGIVDSGSLPANVFPASHRTGSSLSMDEFANSFNAAERISAKDFRDIDGGKGFISTWDGQSAD